jgi:FkbM family methyltransferase
MISKFLSKLYRLSLAVENPILFKVKQKGGISTLYTQLDKKWLHSLNINTILDIGANLGQFTNTALHLLPNAKIYSFEPIPDCFEKLSDSVRNNNNVTTYNIGIGAESGTISFQYNKFSAASSFLPSTDRLKESFPYAGETNLIDVSISRLDDIAKDLEIGDSLLTKIDVQGYEDKVLAGGEKTVKRSKVIIIETSFEKLYEQQPLFDDIYRSLVNWGFSYAGSIDQLEDPNDGRPLQCDAIFIKR